MPPIFSSNRIAPTGRSMPVFVPMPISPSRRAPGSVSSVASRYSWPRSARASTTRPARNSSSIPATSTPRGLDGIAEADAALGRVLDRAGEDLARRHVAAAVGVDPGAAVDAEPQVGAVGLDPQLARAARAARSAAPAARAARPRRRRGRRGRGTSRGGRSPRTPPCPCRPAGRPPAVGQSVPHQRRRSPASRTAARARAARAMRAGSTPASAVTFSGAWIVSEASVCSASASSAGGNASRCASCAAAHQPSAGSRKLGPQQRPRAALEQLALDGEQQRRRQRRRPHDDLLAGPRVEAVAAEQAGERVGVERAHGAAMSGKCSPGARAGPRGSSAARPGSRSGSGRAAPSGR